MIRRGCELELIPEAARLAPAAPARFTFGGDQYLPAEVPTICGR